MYSVTASTFQLFNYICYVVLISSGLGHTAWGVLASYLPDSQRDKTAELDDSGTEKGLIGDNILKSLSKLHMLTIAEQNDAPEEPNSSLLLPDYEEPQEPRELVDEIAEDVSPDDTKDKKDHPSLGFVGSRGRRQPAYLGFVGSRGKKQMSFIPSRGRRQMSTAFVGSRGRRISAEAFSPSRGRRVSSQAFFGSRGKRYFRGSRGKKDSDIENLLLKNQNDWTQDNYNRRAAPFFHGFVASRGKRSSKMS